MACVIIHRLANWNEVAFVQFGYGVSQLYVELSKSKGQVAVWSIVYQFVV
jgi:hypothetical protein